MPVCSSLIAFLHSADLHAVSAIAEAIYPCQLTEAFNASLARGCLSILGARPLRYCVAGLLVQPNPVHME
jgi:hypothetical protein